MNMVDTEIKLKGKEHVILLVRGFLGYIQCEDWAESGGIHGVEDLVQALYAYLQAVEENQNMEDL
jgi:hypothetical protein